MIFEVLEVLGDDFETLSAMKAAKVALKKCSRLPFCRFGEIFEILRVLLGGNLGPKSVRKLRNETLERALEPCKMHRFLCLKLVSLCR